MRLATLILLLKPSSLPVLIEKTAWQPGHPNAIFSTQRTSRGRGCYWLRLRQTSASSPRRQREDRSDRRVRKAPPSSHSRPQSLNGLKERFADAAPFRPGVWLRWSAMSSGAFSVGNSAASPPWLEPSTDVSDPDALSPEMGTNPRSSEIEIPCSTVFLSLFPFSQPLEQKLNCF